MFTIIALLMLMLDIDSTDSNLVENKPCRNTSNRMEVIEHQEMWDAIALGEMPNPSGGWWDNLSELPTR